MPTTLKTCCTHISQRWVLVILAFLALLNAYAMRVCLSMTMIQMVVPINETKEYLNDTCPTPKKESTVNSTAFQSGTYEWDEYTQGIILSSFYWGYIATQIPGGILAEKFGGKYTLGFSILVTGILTGITPFVIWWGGLTTFIILRILMGLTSGMMYPATNVLLSQWIPREEISTAGSMVFAGAPVGAVFSTCLSGLILEYSSIGWPAVFYFFGGCGVVWFILFVILCYNTPLEHPYISDAELKFLHEQLSKHKHKEVPSVPWRQILKSKSVWALIISSVGNGWGYLTLINDLNKYMGSVLKFSIKDNGLLSSLPYLSMWIGGIISSGISDWLIVGNKMSATSVRKWGTTIAAVGPAFFLIAASYAGCDRVAVVVMITLGMFLMGSSLPSIKVNVLDLSPNYAGSLMALTNGFAASTGIFTPYVVGVLTPHQTLEEWRVVFWIVFGVLIASNIVYVIYGSGKVQEWNNPAFLREDKKVELLLIKSEIIKEGG